MSLIVDWSCKEKINIFENASFGKLYLTDDNLKAIYLYHKKNLDGTYWHWLLKEGEEDSLFIFNNDGKSPFDYEFNMST